MASSAQTGTTVFEFLGLSKTGHASTEGIVFSATRSAFNGGNNATVTLIGSASNPLLGLLAPAIDYTVTVTLVPGQAPTVSGSHDGFPAYTITVKNEKGELVATYQYTPGNEFPDVFFLGGTQEKRFVAIPKPKEDDSGLEGL
jgi:hypothetical protein